MAAGRRDIEITKGDDYIHVVALSTRSPGTTALVPVDITGRTYQAMLRKNPAQATPDATFTVAVTDAVNGELTISLPNVTTTALPAGCYKWDLQQNASGVINTILRGDATVGYDVTR